MSPTPFKLFSGGARQAPRGGKGPCNPRKGIMRVTGYLEAPHPLPWTYTPRDPMLTSFCPEVPPRSLVPSPTLPTSNDHDHDLMSYGGCR